ADLEPALRTRARRAGNDPPGTHIPGRADALEVEPPLVVERTGIRESTRPSEPRNDVDVHAGRKSRRRVVPAQAHALRHFERARLRHAHREHGTIGGHRGEVVDPSRHGDVPSTDTLRPAAIEVESGYAGRP